MDGFAGEWSSIERCEGNSLKHLKTIATIQSVGATTRIEGSRLQDSEVDMNLATTPPGAESDSAMRALMEWYARSESVHP